MKQLTRGETHLYFHLYLWLATLAVIWTGVMAASMMPPTRAKTHGTKAQQPASIQTPATLNRLRKFGAPVSLLDEIKTDMIEGAAHLCGVAAPLVRRVAMRESSLRWQVHPVSGAAGYMQVVPRWVMGGARRQRAVSTQAWPNFVEGACRLRRYIDRFGMPGALLAYHGGPTRVMRGLVLPVSYAYARGIMEDAND